MLGTRSFSERHIPGQRFPSPIDYLLGAALLLSPEGLSHSFSAPPLFMVTVPHLLLEEQRVGFCSVISPPVGVQSVKLLCANCFCCDHH